VSMRRSATIHRVGLHITGSSPKVTIFMVSLLGNKYSMRPHLLMMVVRRMKKTNAKTFVAVLGVVGGLYLALVSPTVWAAPTAVIVGPSYVQNFSTINFYGDQSTAEEGKRITEYRWDAMSDDGPVLDYDINPRLDIGTGSPVRLTVTDNTGDTDTATHTLSTVQDQQAPVAVITGPSNGAVGEALTFDGGQSYDPDGGCQERGCSDIGEYYWDYGDGYYAQQGPTPSHSYSREGTYTVTLVVFDTMVKRVV
jgi:hypothetical protein